MDPGYNLIGRKKLVVWRGREEGRGEYGRKKGYGHAPRKKRILIGGNLSSPREGGIPRDRAGYLASPE